MKILLTFPPTLNTDYTKGIQIMPACSIYLLSAVLEEKGYETIIVDSFWYINNGYLNSQKLAAELLNGIDVVGISANTVNWGIARKLIADIYALAPQLPIIVGGVHGTYFDYYILNTTKTSIVVRGEGEKTLPEILGVLQTGQKTNLKQVSGITYRDEQGIIRRNPDRELMSLPELSQLPLPRLDYLKLQQYSFLIFESSRGCPFQCTFCSISHHKSWRAYDSAETLRRLNQLTTGAKTQSAIKTIFFIDDCFSCNKQRTTGIFTELDEKFPDYTFAMEGRITDFDDETVLKSFPQVLIRRYLIGIECGYDEGLSMINKKISIADIRSILKQTKTAGISSKLYCSFIIGFPWETATECIRTIQFAASLVRDYKVQCNINWFMLCPSRLWQQRLQYNINLDESYFDAPNWFLHPNDPHGMKMNFYAAHPLLNEKELEKIEGIMIYYKNLGINLYD